MHTSKTGPPAAHADRTAFMTRLVGARRSVIHLVELLLNSFPNDVRPRRE